MPRGPNGMSLKAARLVAKTPGSTPSKVWDFQVNNRLTPSIEVFCIYVLCADQKEDAGGYYQMSIEGQEIGEPQGPYSSDNDALQAARMLFVQ